MTDEVNHEDRIKEEKMTFMAIKEFFEDITEVNGYDAVRNICKEIHDIFPQLTLVEGEFFDSDLRRYFNHTWLLAPNNMVLDVSNFRRRSGHYHYKGVDNPSGFCPVCNQYTYFGHDCCSDSCLKKHKKSIT